MGCGFLRIVLSERFNWSHRWSGQWLVVILFALVSAMAPSALAPDADTDGDGLPDAWEAGPGRAYGCDPRHAEAKSILDLDRMVHEPARLAILTVLSAAEDVEFLFLLKVTGLSKGNLSVQAQKLEAAGYVRTTKGFRGRIPVTSFTITPEGKKALVAYHAQMRALLPKTPKK